MADAHQHMMPCPRGKLSHGKEKKHLCSIPETEDAKAAQNSLIVEMLGSRRRRPGSGSESERSEEASATHLCDAIQQVAVFRFQLWAVPSRHTSWVGGQHDAGAQVHVLQCRMCQPLSELNGMRCRWYDPHYNKKMLLGAAQQGSVTYSI